MRSRCLPAIIILFSLVGCASSYHTEWVSPEILSQVDPNLTYEDLKKSPESNIGKTLYLGGEILQATRKKDHTQLMILQLPLDSSHEPVLDRMESQGRFLAQELEFLDPAIVPEGTRITIVGSVTGTKTEPLDEMDYTYPTISIKQLKVWPKASEYANRYRPYPYRPYWNDPFYWNPYYFGPYPRPFHYW